MAVNQVRSTAAGEREESTEWFRIRAVRTASTERGMGSLSTVPTVRTQPEASSTSSDSPGSEAVDLLAPEAPAGEGDQDDISSLCVVCGQRTIQTVRPMGRITDPISCCHAHNGRMILRAWIHQLPEFKHFQLGHRLQCRTCSSSCHCQDLADASGHPCACWPPIQDRQELCKEAPPS